MLVGDFVKLLRSFNVCSREARTMHVLGFLGRHKACVARNGHHGVGMPRHLGVSFGNVYVLWRWGSLPRTFSSTSRWAPVFQDVGIRVCEGLAEDICLWTLAGDVACVAGNAATHEPVLPRRGSQADRGGLEAERPAVGSIVLGNMLVHLRESAPHNVHFRHFAGNVACVTRHVVATPRRFERSQRLWKAVLVEPLHRPSCHGCSSNEKSGCGEPRPKSDR
mmetsp:Transcript_71444/g.149311  ORF Transcript_71444/g.149311 Transcript_71444/m.149311 type:complete len:221 (+) Transcript_71444:942-1604(+)